MKLPPGEFLMWQYYLAKNPPPDHVLIILIAKLGLLCDTFFHGFAGGKGPRPQASDWLFWERGDDDQNDIESRLARSAKIAKDGGEDD